MKGAGMMNCQNKWEYLENHNGRKQLLECMEYGE